MAKSRPIIELDQASLAKLRARLRRVEASVGARQLVSPFQRGAEIIRDEMADRAPVGPTGNLKESPAIQMEISPLGVSIKIGPDTKKAPHAHLVEFGTAPHETRVDSAQVLSTGRVTFGRVAQHPGTAAQPFVFPAFEAKKDDAVRAIANDLRGAIQRAVR